MSIAYTLSAIRTKSVKGTRKLILIKLADNANDDGYCYPSLSHLMDECGVCRRTAISHINEMEKMGLIEKETRHKEGRQTSNGYTLLLSEPVLNPRPASRQTEEDDEGCKKCTPGGAKSAPPPCKKCTPGGAKFAPGIYQKNQSSNLERETSPEDPVGEAPKNIDAAIIGARPDCVDQSAWVDFIEHRESIKKPLSPLAARRLANKLERMSAKGINVEKRMDKSIVNGWQDVFGPKSVKGSQYDEDGNRIRKVVV